MKLVKILSLICFLTITIWAQQSATVTETLTEGDKIISDTKIKLVSQSNERNEVTTTTNKAGNYIFENITEGNYWIVYSDSNGNERKRAVNIANGNVFYIDSSIREEVSVIASGTTQTIDEVSKTVNIIDAQEMRDRADFSLIDTLRTIPGFRAQQLGGFGRTATIKTRCRLLY